MDIKNFILNYYGAEKIISGIQRKDDSFWWQLLLIIMCEDKKQREEMKLTTIG